MSASFSLSGLDASSVTDDDIASLETGIASILRGVDASDIDNVAVTDASTRRLLRLSPTERSRRLATAATVSFDVSLSIEESLTYDDDTAFIDAVTNSLVSIEDDSSDLVTAIQSASSTTTFDAIPSTSAVSSMSLVVLTRPPTSAPTPEPTAGWEAEYAARVSAREIMHYALTFGTTLLMTIFAVFVYFTHPAKEKIGYGDCAVAVFAWMDMVGDVCFCDYLMYRASVIDDLGLAHRVGAISGDFKIADPGMLRGFLALALIGYLIPTIFQTFFVAKLIKTASKRGWLDVGRLTKFSTITVILISFTSPDTVILLPFKPEEYKLEDSPFPNKTALRVTAWKALEDSVELVTQVAYLVIFQEFDSFVVMNLAFTLLMMLYDVIAKVLRYACVPDPEVDPEVDKFTSTTKYTWQAVADSDDLDLFLSEAGITSQRQQRGKLLRLLHKDGFDTIGDFHDIRSEKLEMYLNKGIPHINVRKLVEYIHKVWKAHGQETIDDLKLPVRPSEGGFENHGQDNSSVRMERPSVSREDTSKIRRDKMKRELTTVLKNEGQGELLDALWDTGIRKPHQLADIEYDDVSELGITKVQFKVLRHIGRQHSAPSSNSKTPSSPKLGYKAVQGRSAPPSGDVEMKLVNQPATPDEALLGGEQMAEACPPPSAEVIQATQTSDSEKTDNARPMLPPRTPSISEQLGLDKLLGGGMLLDGN